MKHGYLNRNQPTIIDDAYRFPSRVIKNKQKNIIIIISALKYFNNYNTHSTGIEWFLSYNTCNKLIRTVCIFFIFKKVHGISGIQHNGFCF